MNKLLEQIFKFGITGLVNTIIDFGLFNLLVAMTGIHSGWQVGLLNAAAVTAAMINSYLMNRRWTFNEISHSRNSLMRFVLASIIGILINSLVVTAVSNLCRSLPLSIYLVLNAGKIIGAILSSTWNFIAYRNWVFQDVEELDCSFEVETAAVKGMVSIIIPAYNESLRLPQRLRRLATSAQSHVTVEIVVVDDGSTDNTRELVKEISQEFQFIRCLSYMPNQGKGYAVKTGMLNAQGEYIIFVDADETFSWEHIQQILDRLQAGQQVAVGARNSGGSGRVAGESRLRYLMGRTFNLLIQMVILPGCPDSQCGLKGFSREAAREIFSRQLLRGFAFDVEVLALARALQFDVAYVPVEASDCPGSSVNRFLSPFYMALDILRVKLNLGLRRYDVPGKSVP